MNEMELMMQLHRNNQRQGPGSEDTTRLALTLAGINPEMSYKIADIGCGTGAQTITLAKTLKGDIVAVDLFEDFLERLKKNIAKEQTLASVRTLVASMDDLPFQNGTFDIIWSEGAVYNIGFRQGINYWKDFLKTGGILAVSELSWTTKERPAELEEFWTGEYSEMNSFLFSHNKIFMIASNNIYKTPEYNNQPYTFKYGDYALSDYLKQYI